MIVWTCPGCHMSIEATAVAVGHRCPHRRNRITDWTRDTDTTEMKGRTHE